MIKKLNFDNVNSNDEAIYLLRKKVDEVINRLNEMEHPMYVKEYNEVPHRKEEKCIIALCTLRNGHTGGCFNANASEGKGKCCGDCRLFYPRQNLEECSDYNCPCHKPQEEMVEKKVYVVISDLGEETMLEYAKNRPAVINALIEKEIIEIELRLNKVKMLTLYMARALSKIND